MHLGLTTATRGGIPGWHGALSIAALMRQRPFGVTADARHSRVGPADRRLRAGPASTKPPFMISSRSFATLRLLTPFGLLALPACRAG